jgi:hypothetical protein
MGERKLGSMTGHCISVPRGWRIKDGKLVKSDKHLPLNLRLQKRASKRVRVTKRGTST